MSKVTFPQDHFANRHIGLNDSDIQSMLDVLGYESLDHLTDTVIPASIADDAALNLKPALSEEQALAELKQLAAQNKVLKSLIGQGYYGTHTPKVIQRNVLENPAWYTAYTPYQPEISQGRLEVLFYFQTMVTELTGMDIANASLLDESTAAGEALTLAHRALRGKRNRCLVSKNCHPQTLEVLRTRATPLGIELVEFDETSPAESWDDTFGVIVQYPDTYGTVTELTDLCNTAHENGALVIMASDLLALTLLKSPGELGADIVIGNSQRFGVPLGFGGPHAGFFAVRDQFKRSMPGRLVGQSIDVHGNPAYRLALQTREQHIRREKATSNICTAQALLAIMATLYACYHGPTRLRSTAQRVNQLANTLRDECKAFGIQTNEVVFDTVTLYDVKAADIVSAAVKQGINLNQRSDNTVSISLDETCEEADVVSLLNILGSSKQSLDMASTAEDRWLRSDTYMTQDVFHKYHSETEMMRYLRRLSDKDIALDRAMIALGSCTMKLNAASEMTPVTWPEFSNIHPFAPHDQTLGYQKMIAQLEEMLCACTGYDAMSLQPNAGSQGEYAGLLAIKAFHEANGDQQRNICLIPSSAHGTNPASAQMANMQVVVVKCDERGNVDLIDLQAKIDANPAQIAAIMITYPSTHGVFEEDVTKVCEAVHQAGGQVYIDGANLNALVGVAQPGKFGGDVSHLNLHKTFCIPHGGGGPGVGPVGVRSHLAPFLPKDEHNTERTGALISGAPFGSASILPISWMYIRMMGARGLRKATQCAILSANYMAHELKANYPILFTGNAELVAHECIIDTRPMKDHGVSVDDIAKRLIDYGFHAPTMSFPVPGTLMIEPTESESRAELDRFCRAMQGIFNEYTAVKNGDVPIDNSVLSNAPHTMDFVLQDNLDVPYSRLAACHPDPESDYSVKYWPPVGRIDNVYGDKNLICSCPSMSEYEASE
ncbi:aminomethyl-transferring glycine dehydrogenase [Arenicella xantha]|uniref:Glycine dehydrogenase (decarboxylating) n=1 Tax=Arenicella xantha TaxID=644221 RepID=A0A395JLY6_9GAMM|nr:aminomethyl-transferring glycine dehydrogenase [Arenicella xantha]RBP52651.1 glycine dehydrogenase (decarboxylating) alpha subunit /glycine dehydrogenase (decarboxylating) beta subunit [Arenicella xantha]